MEKLSGMAKDQLAFVFFVSFLCTDRKLHRKELESVKAFRGYQVSNQKSSSALLMIRTW